MKIGIKQSDGKFYVNEEKRTIVCVIPHTRYILTDFLSENGYDIDDEMITDMPDSFMGKATCEPNDEWDEELGRLIAFSRAKNKFYESFFKRANKVCGQYAATLDHMINTFNDIGRRITVNLDALDQTIQTRLPQD